MDYHMVNTRKRWSGEAQEMMLRRKLVMACHNTRDEIEAIKKGDVVFLYQNRVGIIAVGQASGDREIIDFEGYDDACMTQTLSNFRRLRTPIQAATISSLLRNFAKYDKGVFRKTRFGIPTAAGKVMHAIAEIV